MLFRHETIRTFLTLLNDIQFFRIGFGNWYTRRRECAGISTFEWRLSEFCDREPLCLSTVSAFHSMMIQWSVERLATRMGLGWVLAGDGARSLAFECNGRKVHSNCRQTSTLFIPSPPSHESLAIKQQTKSHQRHREIETSEINLKQ
jgi:hypothetical protein